MASLRGDKLTVRVQQTTSGVANSVIAATTSVNLDITAEALETTSQDDGLFATYIGGKVSGSISGDFLLASTGEQYTNLYNHMASGDTVEVDVYRDTTIIMNAEGVITGLSLTGGNSDTLTTGSYSIQLSGNLGAT
jgi:hypothetical protein